MSTEPPAEMWPSPPTSVSTPSIIMTDDDDDVDCCMDDLRATPTISFFTLPAELRNLVYQELLLSDSAFRLGHQGPYSHERRKQLYPQIMRTSRMACHEASAILYGSNAFYLGPIGHKPTYSASFNSSIGAHNARMIRTLVAHSTHPARLSQWYLRQWITSFGLDPARLKVLAVSLSTPDKSLDTHHHTTPPTIVSTLPTLPTTHPVIGSTGMLSVNGVITGLFQTHLPNAIITVSSNTPPVPQVDVDTKKDVVVESDYEIATQRMHGWLEPRPRNDVSKLISLINTDLRAEDTWLVFASPVVKARVGLK